MSTKKTTKEAQGFPKTPTDILLGRVTSGGSGPTGFTLKNNRVPLNKKPIDIFAEEEGHLLTIAPTGKGKGRSAIIPTLLSYEGPVIVVDIKGEAAAITAERRKQFGDVVVIDPFRLTTDQPDSLNPFDIKALKQDDSIATLALTLTDLMFVEGQSIKADPFWDRKASALLSGLVAHTLTLEEESKRHYGYVRELLSKGDVVYQLAVILDTYKDMNPFAKAEIAQFLQLSADQTRSCILTTAQQYTYIFGDDKAVASFDKTSFDLQKFKDGKPMSIYLVLPPNKLQSHGILLRLWLGALLEILLERRSKPDLPNLFLIDEAAQLGELEAFRTAMTLMRGYGVKVWSFWQDLSQLKLRYTKDWQTILNNAASIQTFGVNNWGMAKDITAIIGGISPHNLLNLNENEQVLMTNSGKVQKCLKLDYLKDKVYEGLYADNPFYKKQHKQAKKRKGK